MPNHNQNFKFVLIILIGLAIISISFYIPKTRQNPEDILSMKNKSKKIDKASSINQSDKIQILKEKFKLNNSNIIINDENKVGSGPLTVEKILWEDENEFLKVLDKYNAFVRVAGFRTVIPHPLPGEEYNVHLAASLLAGNVVLQGEEFSQNRTLGPYTAERGFKKGPTYSGNKLVSSIGGGICKIASTLYNLVTISNMQVIERHPHSMMVQYVPLGQDATVNYGKMDFKFKNNTNYPIVIWAKSRGNILYMAFYSRQKAPEIVWSHKTVSIDKMNTIYKQNNTIPIDTKVILEGCNGYTVKSWVHVKRSNNLIEKRYLGTDKYSSMTQVIEIGTKP